MRAIKFRILSCVLSIVLLFSAYPQSSLAAASVTDKTAFALDGGVIMEIEQSNGVVHVKTFQNNVLVEEAIGTPDKIELIIYDGLIGMPPSQEKTPGDGPIVVRRHAEKSTERFTGSIDQPSSAKATWVDDEPMFSHEGLASMRSSWFSLTTWIGYSLASSVVAAMHRNLTKTSISGLNAWTWGIGASITWLAVIQGAAADSCLIRASRDDIP